MINMKISLHTLTGFLLIAFGIGIFAGQYYIPSIVASSNPPSSFSGIQTVFCPSPACESLVLSTLQEADTRIWVAMYSFTNENLAQGLMDAKQRGVDVRVIVDKQQAAGAYSQHQELFAAGIPVMIDTNPQLMHNKFAVIDENVLINGSMNWTGNGVGENNENEMVIHSGELNTTFAAEFQKIWNESNAYGGE